MNFYPRLLAIVFLVIVVNLWKSDLMGHPILIGFGFALTLVLRHYSAIWVIELAARTQSELLRYFLRRSSIAVATASPLLLVGIAYAFNLNRFVFLLSCALAGISAGMTGEYEYHRLAVYYPRYSLFYLLGCVDLFAAGGTVAAAAIPIRLIRSHMPRYRPRALRRAASGLHGESDWLSMRTAKKWLASVGIVVGEAYRLDLQPQLGGRAPLLSYDGETGSGHMLVFAGSGGYKTTATVIPSALEVFPRVFVARRKMGHRVLTLNPESRYNDGFNALDWIDISTDRALLDIQRVVAWLCGEIPGERHEDYFRHAARALLGCLLAEILFSRALLDEEKMVHNRELLWNAGEAGEKRRDSQVAREVEFALPEELSLPEAIALARDFVEGEFVARGMVADLNVHWDQGNPQARVMLTMRELTPDGFGLKVTDWNRTQVLKEWCDRADLANERLLRAGIDVRIDHRSFRDQGNELESTNHLGRAVDEMRARGEQPERHRELEDVRERNARKIEERPEIVFDNLTCRQSTFTRRDIAREVFRYIDDGERFRGLMARLEVSPELVELISNGQPNGHAAEPARYTTRTMLRVEERMAETALEMAARDHHPVRDGAFASKVSNRSELSYEQREAVRQMTRPRGIEVIAGFAGSGKSVAVSAAREAWEASGYRVRGAALSGIAGENLEKASGVESRTLASWELAWKNGKAEFSSRDIFVIDEAGMVGSRQMARVLSRLHVAGAKAVLIGDSEQLQPIEAGAAFRAIAKRIGYQELTGILRQQALWQRDASRDFARGETASALDRYREHGAIRFAGTREQAKDQLIRDWSEHRATHREKSHLILAHTRAEVAELNRRAHEVLKERGELGSDLKVETWRELIRDDGGVGVERGARNLAPGDRVMFLKNDREMGVKNGTLGTILQVDQSSMRVVLDGAEGRDVSFALSEYAALDYGYAATAHKAQGATVDRVFLLTTPGMDRHLAYVGMTRHREEATLYAGRDDFKSFDQLRDRLSRARLKDSTLDYAERRGIETLHGGAKPRAKRLTETTRN
jgi:Ti-type conjugative transfer relaxase TraA